MLRQKEGFVGTERGYVGLKGVVMLGLKGVYVETEKGLC